LKKWLIFFVFFILPSSLFGSGFKVYGQGATSSGRAGAGVACLSSPSAVFYNPATASFTDDGFELSAVFVFRDILFTSPYAGDWKLEAGESFSFSLFMNRRVGGKVSFGLALCSPFELKGGFAPGFPGRFILRGTELKSLLLNPAFSFRISARLSLAFGFDLLRANISLDRGIDFSPLFLIPGELTFSGEGWGFGLNGGIILKPGDSVTIGVSCRSPINVTLSGDANFDVPRSMSPYFPDQQASSVISFPLVLSLGLAKTFGGRFTLEGDLVYTGWSVVRRVTIDFSYETMRLSDISMEKCWRDTLELKLGGEYLLNPRLRVRGGFFLGGSPVPADYVDPFLFEANMIGFSIGFGLDIGGFRLNLAYQRIFYQKRVSANPDLPGDFSRSDDFLSLGVTF
jgi:long-chain fatty acid transport protein